MTYEKTFTLLKPDAVQRRLVEPILTIFHENNFDIVAQIIKRPDHDFVMKHLGYTPNYRQTLGRKVLKLYQAKQVDRAHTCFAGQEDIAIGETLEKWMSDYLTSGENIAFVIGGENAIARMRNLSGETFPADAHASSIRGIFGSDSFEICIKEQRSPYNIIHTADSAEEASNQIKLWFPEFELNS